MFPVPKRVKTRIQGLDVSVSKCLTTRNQSRKGFRLEIVETTIPKSTCFRFEMFESTTPKSKCFRFKKFDNMIPKSKWFSLRNAWEPGSTAEMFFVSKCLKTRFQSRHVFRSNMFENKIPKSEIVFVSKCLETRFQSRTVFVSKC